MLEATDHRAHILRTVPIQTLWSGYGEIFRCELTGGKSVVVKHIQLPDESHHPRGWDTLIGHQRKLKSYQVEMNWYQGLARLTDEYSRVPQWIDGWQGEREMLLILEDLNASGYPSRPTDLTQDQIKSCLSWLAHFHARYLQSDPAGLWEIGSYWHLDTRPDEWQAMTNQALQSAAKDIDTRLNQAQYQTLVHGDAKLANFCFSENGPEVAAVDFQYIGRGCGMKDVAYFLSSCLSEQACASHETELLNHYFDTLTSACRRYDVRINIPSLVGEWRVLYKYAWADFYRFLDGWSPGHYKMNSYSQRLTNEVLDELKHEV
ncbi:choline kinase [Reichenbachiella sp. 5M10]|nr:choline kinase [Reichenbachiella sp. 5M10]